MVKGQDAGEKQGTKRSSNAPVATGPLRTLVIVESPTKANTIRKYLGEGYEVEASVGHVRDLVERKTDLPEGDPRRDQKWVKYGVNIENGFVELEEAYIVPPEKQRQVTALRQQLKKCDQLFLATDDDREGEAISWHLLEVLQPKVPVQRLVFHEITREAIRAAVENPRALNEHLVSAQRTRRVVDRLYGWDVSELLWRKIKPGLSAGRVQSVALRLLVQRERERMAFVSADWSSVHANLLQKTDGFEATLLQIAGKRVASGRDFDATTGQRKADVVHLDQAAAQALVLRLRGQTVEVTQVEKKPQTMRPSPPFTTSTLQQEANRKLRWPARQTMQVAQRLYENGFITYMRTDSVSLSEQAVNAARNLIHDQYGPAYLPEKPRRYQTKVANAQEAHEAIRPAGTEFPPLADVARAVGHDEAKLYELIWKRTVASQMADALLEQTSADLKVLDCLLRATGRVTRFPGYLKAYVEGSDDPDQALADRDAELPALAVGDRPSWGDPGLRAESHTTQPPARLNDATLVRSLEEAGIGRPSTYAAILQNLLDKTYAFRRGQALVPTFMGIAVVTLLETHMPHLVDYAFTAKMEQQLDKIASGDDHFTNYLKGFYIDGIDSGDHKVPGLRPLLADVKDRIDPALASAIAIGIDPDGIPVQVRIGRYGTFVKIGDRTANVPDTDAPDEMTVARALHLVEQKAKGDAPMGEEPGTGRLVFLRNGRFGWYLQAGVPDEPAENKKNVSLSKGMEPDQVDMALALRQLQLPRTLGKDAKDTDVTAHAGRYGDYVQRGDDRRNLPPGRWAIDVSLAEAVALLEKPRGALGREHLVDLGTLADGTVVGLWSGRYGPYVTDGTRNATVKSPLPGGGKPEDLSLEAAVALLDTAAAAKAGRQLGLDPESNQPVRVLDGRFGPYVTNGAINASLARGTLPTELTLEGALDRLRHFGKPVKAKKGKGGARKAPAKAAAPKAAAKVAKPAAEKKAPAAKKPAAAKKPPAKQVAAKVEAAPEPLPKSKTGIVRRKSAS